MSMTPDNAKSEIEKIEARNKRGCGSYQQKSDIAYLLNLLDARDRAHAELELKEVTKLRQEVKDLKLTIAAKERMIKAKQVVIDSVCDEHAKLEADLAEVKKDRDLWKKSEGECDLEYDKLLKEVASLRAALVEKDKAFKSITQWGFTADQRKFEGNHKKVIKMIVQIAQEALTPEAAGKAQEKDGEV